MNVIQSIAVLLELRPHGSSTWLSLVCLDGFSNPWVTTTNETDTACGIAVGMGPIKFNPTGTGVVEASPGPTQITHQHLRNWQVAQTVLDYRIQYPTTGGGSVGANLYSEGQVLVTNTQDQYKIDDVVKFQFTLSGLGQPTNVAGVVV